MAFPSKMMIDKQVLTPGIICGIGPLSHTDFERLLLRVNKNAKQDQDHPVYLLANAISISNRPKAVERKKAGNPALAKEVEDRLVFFANLLAEDGADFVLVLCNGTHYWYERVTKRISVPWVNMIEVTAKAIKKQYPDADRVGILASDATLRGKLYHKALKKEGLDFIAPEVYSDIQKKVMGATFYKSYAVKVTGDKVSDRAKQDLVEAADWLKEKGVQVVVAGCTEISVALTYEIYKDLPIVDPMTVLAKTTFDLAMGKESINAYVRKS